MAYLSGYSKYKVLTLTGGASGALTDHQLEIAVSYEAAMQGDFDDIRFTQADGTTLVDAWAEVIVTDTSATVWVEFPTTPANTVEQIYRMYYGNAGAANYWDIGATFIDGWDFESDIIGNVPAGWTEDAANGSFRTVAGKTARLQHSSGDATVSNNYASITSITGDNNRAIQFTVNPAIDPTYDYIIIHDSSAHAGEGIFLSFKGDGNITYYSGGWNTLQAYDASTDYKIEIYNIDLTNNQFDIDINGVNRGTNLGFFAAQASLDYFTYEGAGAENADENIDNVFVRKYTANPPTYAFGAEQSVPIGHPTMKRWGGIPGMQYTGRRSW